MIYHKIQSIYKRRLDGDRSIIEGDWTCPEFEYLAGIDWEWSEKIDGTNIRIYLEPEGVRIAGRTDKAQLSTKLTDAINTLIPEVPPHLYSVCLHGEGYGGKIQKGGKYRPDESFILFDVSVGNMFLRQSDVTDIADQLGLVRVRTYGSGPLFQAVEMVKGGLQSRVAECEAEGIVARPKCDLRNRRGSRIICKIKGKDFK